MINIDELTIKDGREISAIFGCKSQSSAPFNIGKNYFIRTVTHHLTGRLVEVHPTELVLENAAWIADDGKFSMAVANSNFNEVEVFPANALVIIGRGSLIDAVEISSIPTSTK